ncbi:TetR/AcrR family transcriptional regulator [Oceanobacillus saliphilus]|uniref:TetR/AcrR family transcriptional regulator n=1 Tax=Oceanobacillus saliphilus TaxID=2925834 RepID=UPI00201E4D5E|nr:TetR/AcrR family transcriptional regulator [Oceanobacillus saliphilus]
MDGFEKRRKEKKKNILVTAQSLFTAHGVKNVSVAQIAKKANVSQVTIYNYFESKHKLVHEVFIHYVDTVSKEYEALLNRNIAFPEKIKQIIFNKKESAKHIHEDFYNYFMKDYSQGINYIEELYAREIFPKLIELFNEGRKQGYMNHDISNEAILFYIQMIKEAMQRKDVYQKLLPMTEDITKLLFYGIIGNGKD